MKPVKSSDMIERILIILIMVLELIIIFKAMTTSLALGLVFWLLFQIMDFIIAHIHKKYFGEK